MRKKTDYKKWKNKNKEYEGKTADGFGNVKLFG